MLRDEHVGGDGVVGTGGPHAVGVPHVGHGHVADRQQRERRVQRVVGAAQRGDDDPVSVHDAGRPGPSAGEADAAAGRKSAPGRREWGRCQERAAREGLFLGLLAEQREHPVVQGQEADGPGARRASVGHPAYRVQDGREIGLLTAIAGGHQEFGESGVDEVGHRRVGKLAQLLGFTGPIGQSSDEFGGDDAVRGGGRGHGRKLPYFFVWSPSRGSEEAARGHFENRLATIR